MRFPILNEIVELFLRPRHTHVNIVTELYQHYIHSFDLGVPIKLARRRMTMRPTAN